MTKRPAITPAMKVSSLLYHNDIPCSWCDGFLLSTDQIEWDHFIPLAMGGPHDDTNILPMHRHCHRKKTSGSGSTTAGSDIGKISKERRIIRTQKMAVVRKDAIRGDMRPTPKRKWPKRKLEGRPFEKRRAP